MDAWAAWVMLWIIPADKLSVRHKDTNQGVKLKIHPATTHSSDLGSLQNYFSVWVSALQSHVHDRSLLLSLGCTLV